MYIENRREYAFPRKRVLAMAAYARPFALFVEQSLKRDIFEAALSVFSNARRDWIRLGRRHRAVLQSPFL
jgi:hypothetical protein